MTLNELLDPYLDGIDADARLSVKTRFDYRKYADSYLGPLLGDRRLRDVAAETAVFLEVGRHGRWWTVRQRHSGRWRSCAC